jgi:iron(III) transport system ATP-binding protein
LEKKTVEIRIRHLSKSFYVKGKKIEAVKNVDLTIPPSKIFTILGPSGCGKTTLLRCLAGLEFPDSGEIEIGSELVWYKERKIFVPPDKRGIGMVFQTYAIWPHMSVFENVAYPLQVSKVPTKEIKSRVTEALAHVRLVGFEDRAATRLSGGQQQRVALARALVFKPRVILFDEPLSNLDAKLREEMRNELRRFLTQLNMTTLYVTHDQIEALALSDVIAIMNDGAIVETGTPKEIYLRPKDRFVADFIGKANLIEGKVTTVKNHQAIIDSPIGRIVSEAVGDVREQDRITVRIRPTSFQLADEEKEFNTFNAKVESLVFVGESYEATVKINGLRIMVKLNSTANIKEGDAIKLYIHPASCNILAR